MHHIYNSKDIELHVEDFNQWINAIYNTYETDISIFADGLGTYLIGKYLTNEELYKNVRFDKIILAKSLLNPNFNWKKEFDSRIINLVINLKDMRNVISINEKIPKEIIKSDLYGESYKVGFNNNYDNLIDYNYKYNMKVESDDFKRDILPMFHISDALIENNDNEVFNNFDLIINREVKFSDIIIKK